MGLYYTLFVIPVILPFYFWDKTRQERLIAASNTDWVIVRPAVLTNGRKRGSYRSGPRIGSFLWTVRISRADVADFMLMQLTDDANLRTAPGVRGVEALFGYRPSGPPLTVDRTRRLPDRERSTTTAGCGRSSSWMRSRRLVVSCAVLALAALALASAPPAGLSAPPSGYSGNLRAVFALPGQAPPGVPDRPGIYSLAEAGRRFVCIVLTPFSAKVNGWIGGYRLGKWPFELHAPSNPVYEDPPGFVEVTQENLGTPISEHFTLGQFVTKGRRTSGRSTSHSTPGSWTSSSSLSKSSRGRDTRSSRLTVMSGFRTPDYNESGGNPGGRSAISRHMFGDAADVYPDSDGRGMDDLNHDGRRDIRDARIVAAAADAVEAKHPELVGGIGVYPGRVDHGPFVHIDARGRRARWGE